MKSVRKTRSPSRKNTLRAVPFVDAEIGIEVVGERVPWNRSIPCALSAARCRSAARAKQRPASCRGRSGGRDVRPDPRPWSSRGRHGQASRTRRVRRRRGRRSAAAGRRTGRAGRPGPRAPRTHSPRRTAIHGSRRRSAARRIAGARLGLLLRRAVRARAAAQSGGETTGWPLHGGPCALASVHRSVVVMEALQSPGSGRASRLRPSAARHWASGGSLAPETAEAGSNKCGGISACKVRDAGPEVEAAGGWPRG